jgi:iron(III) transport system substrate-binding protein
MYKGKISAGRPDKSGSAFIQLALILQIYGEDKGWEIYQRILDNTVLSNSSGAVSKFVNDGEAAMGPVQRGHAAEIQGRRRPGGTALPGRRHLGHRGRDGAHRHAANPKGGKAFINFMLSKEAQEILDGAGRRSVRADVVTKNALTPLSQDQGHQVRRRLGRRQPHAHPGQVERLLLNKK